NPLLATFLGYEHEKYDHLLPNASLEANEENIFLFFQGKKEIENEIDYAALTDQGKLDYDLLTNFFNLQLFLSNELATWRSGISPNGAPIGVIGAAIYPLYTRDFAPLKNRVDAIISRLKASSSYLEETKSTWQFPVKLWTEIAIEEGPRTIGFLQLILQTLKPNIETSQFQKLSDEINNVSQSINDYVSWLETEVLHRSIHHWAIGSQKFSRLIESRKLGKTPDEILKFGEEIFHETKKELEKLANDLFPGKSVEEAREIIKSDHPPTFEMVLEHVRELSQEARRFVYEHNLMKIPEGENLSILPTPSFLVPMIPFAAYMPPEKFSEDQTGQYIVTPIEGNEERLKEHSYASLRNTAVHEAYPGHHLQISSANLQPNLIRSIISLFSGDETAEGWAHYCEQLMAEKGFSGEKEIFIQLIDQLWRAVRIIVDVKIHTGQLTFEEAKEFMSKEIGMEEYAVDAELKRYTMTPGYPLSYLLGKRLLLELRDNVKEKLGEKYSDQFFHNTILENGGLPIHFLKRLFDIQIAGIL
ncbi:MAG: DUF885 domain-containing protein, partial [Candidatus Hodarchaeales archaeon]